MSVGELTQRFFGETWRKFYTEMAFKKTPNMISKGQF